MTHSRAVARSTKRVELLPPLWGRMRSLSERSELRRSWMGVTPHDRGGVILAIVLLTCPLLPSMFLSSTAVRRHPPSQPSPTRGEGAHRVRHIHMRLSFPDSPHRLFACSEGKA